MKKDLEIEKKVGNKNSKKPRYKNIYKQSFESKKSNSSDPQPPSTKNFLD